VGPAELAAVRKAADAGSPEALAVLGRFYQKGEEVPKDLVVAASYYIRAIRMDSPRAGELLWAIASDKKFVSELKARAAKDDVHAQFSWPTLVALGFGPLLMQNQAYLTDPQAFRMLRKAADRGDTQSMIELGLCYYAGRWVARDEARALLLWQEAAHAGSREAQIRIAVTDVRNGSSSGGDTAAVQMLSRAVTDGSVLAEMALGYCYENGIGVPRVPAEAARLYRAAARRGSQDAYRALKRMYDRIRPADPQYVIAD
jgi:TPR repeat protein